MQGNTELINFLLEDILLTKISFEHLANAVSVDFKNTSEQNSRKYNIVFNRTPKNRNKNVFPAPTV